MAPFGEIVPWPPARSHRSLPERNINLIIHASLRPAALKLPLQSRLRVIESRHFWHDVAHVDAKQLALLLAELHHDANGRSFAGRLVERRRGRVVHFENAEVSGHRPLSGSNCAGQNGSEFPRPQVYIVCEGYSGGRQGIKTSRRNSQ